MNHWNDLLEIEGDAREEVANLGFEEMETPEEIAEFENWLDTFEGDNGDAEALESVYGPND